MSWKPRIEQLIGLLEKVPRPASYKNKTGVYQPFFVLELRPAGWEVQPMATYTRLDGSEGRETRLTFEVLDHGKVNINKNELSCLFYLYAGGGNQRPTFSYGQPVGFLLEWLSQSRLLVRDVQQRELQPISFYPQACRLVLRFQQTRSGYQLVPSLVTPEGNVDLNGRVVILTANPMYLLYQSTLYRLESELPAVFWSNFFRVYQQLEIPSGEIDEFIRLYLPHILPVLDWENLGEHIRQRAIPLAEKRIVFAEEEGHLHIQVHFIYGEYPFPAYPATERSLAREGQEIFMIPRDVKEENAARRFLEEHGLIYRNGYWQIATDYYIMDWMRQVVPRLERAGFRIVGEDQLSRYRVHRQTPQLQFAVKTTPDGLQVKYQFRLGRKAVEIPDLFRQIASEKRYLRLKDGSHVYLPPEMREQILRLTHLVDLKGSSGRFQLPMAGLAVIKELDDLHARIALDEPGQQQLEAYRRFERIQPTPPPAQLRTQLRDYQRHGLDWLCFLHQFRFGGILADDMGLGKTVQVIALLARLKETGQLTHPALVVVPLTLVFNWREELERFAPHLNVLCYQGTRSERAKLQERIADHDVVIASYGVVLQDQETLRQKPFDYLILDESQKIKNPQTKTHRALARFKIPHRLALTGTPVENSPVDLWAQFNILNPGLLGSLSQFKHRYVDVSPELARERLESLQRIIYPFILRRTKSEVEKELPPLTEVVQHVEMTELQRQIYHRWLERYREEIFNALDGQNLSRVGIKIVEALTYLRQIACHPAILEQDVPLDESGKVQLLADMVEDLIAQGHKILIFSQFVRFLALVRRLFETRGWRYEYLDGSVRNRAEHIRRFQSEQGVSAFLISLKAGGLGLNLTAADYVIHLDPWWNPAVEQQATDRAHRIGQDKRVFVYKYIVKDSVEEKILSLQERKKELFQQLITSDRGLIKNLTREDLELIFGTNGRKEPSKG